MQSMFFYDGELIPEPEYDPRQVSSWVNVFLKDGDKYLDDDAVMRMVALQIRTGAGTVSVHPLHHTRKLCISIKVPGDYHSSKASIYASAELQADYYRQEIRAGRVRLNRDLLFRDND